MTALTSRLSGLCRKLAQTARLACGVPDYDNYLRHMREQHPQTSPMTHEQFFANRLQARYRPGSSRCC